MGYQKTLIYLSPVEKMKGSIFMALGMLLIIYMIIAAGVLLAQIFLYKEKSSRKFFIINMSLGVLISLLSFTSFPSNFVVRKTLAVILGLLAVLGYSVYAKGKNELLAKILLSISVVGNVIQFII